MGHFNASDRLNVGQGRFGQEAISDDRMIARQPTHQDIINAIPCLAEINQSICVAQRAKRTAYQYRWLQVSPSIADENEKWKLKKLKERQNYTNSMAVLGNVPLRKEHRKNYAVQSEKMNLTICWTTSFCGLKRGFMWSNQRKTLLPNMYCGVALKSAK